MAIERHEDDMNGCSLYCASHIAFEYGPTIKWLRSKTSDVHHIHCEDIWLNNEGVDHSDWMDRENEDIFMEEIEEDDIEDW